MDRLTLDLGCGNAPRGDYGVDIVEVDNPSVKVADLTWDAIPFESETFDRVFAYDFLEHLPKRVWWREVVTETGQDGVTRRRYINYTRDVHIELFNEIYRVLKPGGVFESFTPHMPYFEEVHRDPTHVSVWVPGAWEYYAGSMVGLMRHYGYTAEFKIQKKEWRGAHYYVELVK